MKFLFQLLFIFALKSRQEIFSKVVFQQLFIKGMIIAFMVGEKNVFKLNLIIFG